MTHPAAAPAPAPSGDVDPAGHPAAVPARLRVGMHVLVAGLLGLAALRGVTTAGGAGGAAVGLAVLVGAVYAVGPGWVGASPRAATPWLVVLLGSWVLLLLATADAVYLAFPWSFLLLHLLPRRAGLAAVAATTAAAVAGFAWHQRTVTAGMVLGPVLGAAVVVATVLGYQALLAESERRLRLIDELARTRDELAAAERHAGTIEERERLAREIHDTIAQGLSSIQLLLTAAHRGLDPARPLDQDRARGLVEQARGTAKDTLDEARRVVRALSPGDLDGSTLPAALRRLCQSAAARTGIGVVFHHEGPVTALGGATEVALLRIAQGALGNAEQHSGATRVAVTLTVMDTAVTLDVVDDGTGFDPRTPPRGQGGFGLGSMRSRAADLGGFLTVESRPGAGTAVSAHLDRTHPRPCSARPRSADTTYGGAR